MMKGGLAGYVGPLWLRMTMAYLAYFMLQDRRLPWMNRRNAAKTQQGNIHNHAPLWHGGNLVVLDTSWCSADFSMYGRYIYICFLFCTAEYFMGKPFLLELICSLFRSAYFSVIFLVYMPITAFHYYTGSNWLPLSYVFNKSLISGSEVILDGTCLSVMKKMMHCVRGLKPSSIAVLN